MGQGVVWGKQKCGLVIWSKRDKSPNRTFWADWAGIESNGLFEGFFSSVSFIYKQQFLHMNDKY